MNMPPATWKVTEGAQHEHWRFAMQQHHTTPEEWRPVVGYEGRYEISDRGRIKSLIRGGKISLGGRDSSKGDTRIRSGLSSGGSRRYFYIHTMVLTAFFGPKPDGHECAHWDGDPTNNHISNLRWATHKENADDAKRHGTLASGSRNGMNTTPDSRPNGTRNGRAKLTAQDVLRLREMRDEGLSYTEMGLAFGVHRTTIRRAINGERWASMPLEQTP